METDTKQTVDMLCALREKAGDNSLPLLLSVAKMIGSNNKICTK